MFRKTEIKMLIIIKTRYKPDEASTPAVAPPFRGDTSCHVWVVEDLQVHLHLGV